MLQAILPRLTDRCWRPVVSYDFVNDQTHYCRVDAKHKRCREQTHVYTNSDVVYVRG